MNLHTAWVTAHFLPLPIIQVSIIKPKKIFWFCHEHGKTFLDLSKLKKSRGKYSDKQEWEKTINYQRERVGEMPLLVD
jgi:hypothetical protein